MRKIKLTKIAPLTMAVLVGLAASSFAQDTTRNRPGAAAGSTTGAGGSGSTGAASTTGTGAANSSSSTGGSSASTDTSRRSKRSMGPVKTFGGAKQFATFSLGVNVGGFTPVVAWGGLNQFSKNKIQLGYGAFLKYQVNHAFGFRLDYAGGKLSATNDPSTQNGNASYPRRVAAADTKVTYMASLKGEVDVASINFLHRTSGLRLFLTGGYGLAQYKPTRYGSKSIKSGYLPLGAGIKFKASEALAINLGYDVYLFDGTNLLGTPYVDGDARQSKASMGYIGLEYIFGAGKRPALVWNNPIATLYDDLKSSDSLSKEIDGLKSRVSAVEGDVSNLKKDSDGDGVSDVFDKCPNTPAGTKVDGSGCELPKMEVTASADTTSSAVQDRVQFDFDSDKIRTNSYPTMDRLADRLKTNRARILLAGHASSEGTEEYNMGLSQRRAKSVSDYLSNAGVPSSQIKTKGYGETRPIASNDTEEGRVKNRRVEFRFGAQANVGSSTTKKHRKTVHKKKKK